MVWPSYEESDSCEFPYKLYTYKDFDVSIPDIDEAALSEIGFVNEIENLSPGTFPSSPFPVSGDIHGPLLRFTVPLVCQPFGKPDVKTVNVWFLCDTGFPFTCLSKKSLEALYGEDNTHTMHSLAIHDLDSRITCHLSKQNFKEVNILGTDAMRSLQLSIVMDWKKNKFQLIQQ